MNKNSKGQKTNNGKARRNVRLICFAGMFAALVFVATSFTKIPLGSSIGYVHIGDAFIYLAAALMPAPYAMAAAAIGASFADWFLGAPIWIIATAPIKALSALCFTSKNSKMLCRRNVVAIGASALIGAGGYYLYEALLYVKDSEWPMSFIAPMSYIIPNILQSVVSGVAFVLISLLLDRYSNAKSLFRI